MSTVCVIDADGVFVTETDRRSYALQEGERFIDAEKPVFRPYGGYPGFVKPTWDGSKWREGASIHELLRWEFEHLKTGQ